MATADKTRTMLSQARKKKSKLYSREEDDLDPFEDIVIDEAFARSKGCAMPELVNLLDDPEVLLHLKNPKVTEYLRKITLDPSQIPNVIDTSEMQFLKRKMIALIKKTYPDAVLHDV